MKEGRYHVEVNIRIGGDEWSWRRVHPVGGDPYVFTRDEALQYIKTQASNGHDVLNWRIIKLEDL